MFPLIDKRETGINLRRIMDMRGVTPKDVQQFLGLGCVQSFYRWYEGVSTPSIDNLYALSELLQVPIDAIVCGNRMPIVSDIVTQMCPNERKPVFTYYKKLNEQEAA